jgi:hypothetical protein
MLVGTGQVLTCAHVISDGPDPPSGHVFVDFIALPGTPSVRARVAPGCWVPVRDDDRGDLALLDLEGTRPDSAPAPLRRKLSWGRQVRAFGFPDGAEAPGVWAQPVLAGPGGPDGEWVQMNSPSDDTRVTRGFSGSAVIDHDTGSVIGMVVSEYVRERPSVSWMLPVETILRHLHGLSDHATGLPAVDPPLKKPGPSIDVGFADRIASWLSSPTGPQVLLVLTGEPESSTSSGLRKMIVLADRELRPPAADRTTDGAVPPVGSVDLALDATGKSVSALAERIADRFGDRADAADAQPMTLVVAGVDDATDPESLLHKVLKPLTDKGMRLLLEFRRESSPSWGLAHSLWQERHKTDDDVLRSRLEALATMVADVADRENALSRQRENVATRIAAVPALPEKAVALRLRLSALRQAGDLPARRLVIEVAAAEASVSRAVRRLAEFERRLDELLERRRELRGRLAAYHAMAVDQGLTESDRIDRHYRRAHDALWRGPSDLIAAARLVDEYRAAIRKGG